MQQVLSGMSGGEYPSPESGVGKSGVSGTWFSDAYWGAPPMTRSTNRNCHHPKNTSYGRPGLVILANLGAPGPYY
eukprot:1541733-Pyramimonas_sp.AAC.1